MYKVNIVSAERYVRAAARLGVLPPAGSTVQVPLSRSARNLGLRGAAQWRLGQLGSPVATIRCLFFRSGLLQGANEGPCPIGGRFVADHPGRARNVSAWTRLFPNGEDLCSRQRAELRAGDRKPCCLSHTRIRAWPRSCTRASAESVARMGAGLVRPGQPPGTHARGKTPNNESRVRFLRVFGLAADRGREWWPAFGGPARAGVFC